MTHAKHAPLPWEVSGNVSQHYHHIYGGDNTVVAEVHKGTNMSGSREEANAEFITRACNSHYELLSEAEKNQQFIDDLLLLDLHPTTLKKIMERGVENRTTIAKAKEAA